MAQQKKVSASQLVSMDICHVKGYFESLALHYLKGKSYSVSVKLKELFKTIDFQTFTGSDIVNQLDSMLDDSLFVAKRTKKEELALLTEQLVRYFSYEQQRNRTVLQRGVIGDVKVKDTLITVTADFVFENKDHVEIVKIKKSEPKLSYSGRKFESKAQNSIELYLLTLLGKQLVKDKPVVASLYHLKSKDDTRTELVPDFEVKKGKNIISHVFTNEQADTIEERIVNMLNMELSLDSEKTCEASHCEHCSFANICHYEQGKQVLPVVEETKKAGELKLTKNQYEAIFFRKGIARINAGAGSGKTTVIALRVAELLQEGVHPKDILLLTFTNQGAREMRERILYWTKEIEIEGVDVKNMDILTFNAWGEKIIQSQYKTLGFSEVPSLAEKVQVYDIIFEILEENDKLDGFDYRNPLINFPNARGVVVQLSEYFETLKGTHVLDAIACSEKLKLTPSLAQTIFDLYQKFNQKLQERNLIEYQDQITLIIDLVQDHPNVFARYGYQHIIVDEYQDTDSMQFDVVSALTDLEKFISLMVVGDDSQSIFSWRYTSQENILNFHKFFAEVKDIYFLENFRSTPEIIETANKLNDLNQHKINKTLVSKAAHGQKPILWSYRTQDEEYAGIATLVEEKIQNGTRPENIAVIARTKSELLMVEQYLKEKNIPTVLDVAEALLNNKNVQIMISLIDFFEDESCTYNLMEYLYVFNQEIKEMNQQQVKAFVEEYRVKLMKSFLALTEEQDKIDFYFRVTEEIAKVDTVVESFLEELKRKGFMTLSALFTYLKKLVLYKDEKPVTKKDVRYQAVVLTTAHSSKGKEFDVVINTIDRYKHDSLTMKPEEIEEERRLLFVSITRAKKLLYVTYHTHQDRIKIKGTYCKFADELQDVERVS
ncbi:ATP-dependent helicase (plasmid) [Aneurinibacillus sp. Ricciae_BoGa-3]|uniref:ATP-dependent helicase n=1 Tax=Aneurinibacillus sp. Ricciae_BoGa-3 TaxID=3022697 RepID=UPI0023412C8F|nr:ATP-dependent helicase [Aneurinibacillus sp. Ricciae_BoGa-3]WCK57149.1 ATP-dependent helicase [Aneurinibacillus sp. Ricciae_BoGa-3]